MKIYTDSLIKKLSEKYGTVRRRDQFSFYSFVLSQQTLPARDRIENWIDEFPQLSESKDFLNSLRHWRSHHQTVAQLVAGVALKRHGFSLEAAKEINGKTPDWFVSGRDELPNFIVEVTTINPPPSTQTAIDTIHDFLNSVRKFRIGVTLDVTRITDNADTRTELGNQKTAVRRIAEWLRTNPPFGSTFEIAGFQFLIEEWKSGSDLMTTKGFRTTKTVDPTGFEGPLREKVSKYRSLVEDYSLPLWVAIQVDDRVALRYESLTEVLSGRRGALSPKEAKLSPNLIRHILSPANKGLFERLPLLSGVIWIECDHLANRWTLLPIYNHFATHKLPPGMLKEVRMLPSWQRHICRPSGPGTSAVEPMRYFLLFWTAKFPVPENPSMTGYAASQRAYASETFMSHDEIIADIERTNPTYEQIAITNLIELSANDYFNWISEDRRHLKARYESDVIISYD